ncbi:MAG: DUF1573 domain-containing protein [Opitutae bacterium]|nr:DUF1573 domain-containing protein [Opitutae bacterium]
MRTVAILLGVLSACLPNVHAGLEWPTKEISQKTTLGQETADVEFSFRNTGTKPVRIVSVTTGCSCMAATPAKELYAPGESGSIRAEVRLAGREGQMDKAIEVVTEEPDKTASKVTTTLTIRLDIPQPVIIKPRLLYWKPGETPGEKEIFVTLIEGVTLESWLCDPPEFEVQQEQLSQPGQYRLRVKPKSAQQPANAMIHLTVKIAGNPTRYDVFLSVKPPGTSPARP